MTTATTDTVTEEQLEEIYQDLCEQLHKYFDHMSADEALAQLVNAALYTVWCERMAADGDRETFEEVLRESLSEEWEAVTIH